MLMLLFQYAVVRIERIGHRHLEGHLGAEVPARVREQQNPHHQVPQ